MILLIKLLLAHIIGDFVFQPKKWVTNKEKNKIKSPYLYMHLFVHAATLLVILQFNKTYLWGFIIIIISHFIIDVLKLYISSNNKLLFFSDQFLHILIILFVVYIYEPFTPNFGLLFEAKSTFLLLSVLFATFVSSVIIKILISHWTAQIDSESELLADAGKYIGILERLFIFTFILLGQWSIIGFLLAAKSVFRFGDLTRAKDRKLTEYVLIGTFISYAFAIATALVYIHFSETIANE